MASGDQGLADHVKIGIEFVVLPESVHVGAQAKFNSCTRILTLS
jgi:hypothetical protein